MCKFDELMSAMQITSVNTLMRQMLEQYTLRLMKSLVADDVRNEKGSMLTLKSFGDAFVRVDGGSNDMGHGDRCSTNLQVIAYCSAPWEVKIAVLGRAVKVVKPELDEEVAAHGDDDEEVFF